VAVQVFGGIFFLQSKANMAKPIFYGKYILTDIIIMLF
jgi:hypothetical protein